MRELIYLTKALADAHRVRILMALRAGELCVCQITELFGLAASTISRHLSLLHRSRLVQSRKNGRWIYYALPGKESPAACKEALAWLTRSLKEDPQITTDAARLTQILQIDPVELCKRQCRD